MDTLFQSPIIVDGVSFLAQIDGFERAILTASAIGVAGAVLSVIVVLRRWAFIGEGIAHAGLGGIGTGWLLSISIGALASPAAVYGVAILFCLAVAMAIGYVTLDRDGNGERIGSDSAIGIFMVASLAWGYLALALYNRHHHSASVASAEQYLFGSIDLVTPAILRAGVAVAAAVLVCVGALFKEILYYTFDPLMARVSGVRTALIHYFLMLLLALVIVIGMQIAGTVLVTALLVLPGATALLVTQKLKWVIVTAMGASLIACIIGPVLNRFWLNDFPSGPAIVLVLFVEFLGAYLGSRFQRLR